MTKIESYQDSLPSVCFCTLAIHAPYRKRARQLCADAPTVPWVILTDEPEDFRDLSVRAIYHEPTGPMAIDYLERLAPTGNNHGAAAYHDKRFALIAALQNHDTAIFLDADSRLEALPTLTRFPDGFSVTPVVLKSIAEHLETCGTWRQPAFVELAKFLTGDSDILQSAKWCHETCIAVTKDGKEKKFFETWGKAAEFMQSRGVFSGEGGVLGLAAAIAGWDVDYEALNVVAAAIKHESGGPKED